MARPKKETEKITIALTLNVLETLENDSDLYGMSKGAYISQLIMQKHLEMTATGLISKLTDEQIQIALSEAK